jgi:hypothetical protein
VAPFLGLLVLVVAALGCGPIAPVPSVSPGASSATEGPSPLTTPNASPASTSTIAPAPQSLTITLLAPEFVPSPSLRSFGSEMLWTAGPRSTADIWRAAPGQAPERIFENPLRDSLIREVVRNEAGYAFVESNDRAYGPGGWRVWYLPKGSGTPTEVDRGASPNAGGPPGVSLDDLRLAWAGFDEPAAGSYSFLRVAEVSHLATFDTVLQLPIEDGLIWTPILDGYDVWYAVINADFEQTGVGDEFHIESIDLSSANRGRTRFAGTANDFAPAVSPTTILWKTVAPGFAALNWGAIHALDRASGRMDALPIDNANNPSVGGRFGTFEEISRSKLLLYDRANGDLIDMTASLPKGTTSVGEQSVSGSLLVFAVTIGSGLTQVAWAMLPE